MQLPIKLLNSPVEPTKEEIKPEIRGPFRPWPQEQIKLFFEALNENGKDFEAIHTYINSKLKKRNLPEPVLKTKEQVRCFYNRMWHKISKHIKFSEGNLKYRVCLCLLLKIKLSR